MENPETKKFADIFCEAFLFIFKYRYFAKPSRSYFRFFKKVIFIQKQWGLGLTFLESTAKW
jgi:hypothetical protein